MDFVFSSDILTSNNNQIRCIMLNKESGASQNSPRYCKDDEILWICQADPSL